MLPNGVINISAIQDDEFVQISIQDNGIGISQEDIEALFKAPFRSQHPQVVGVPAGSSPHYMLGMDSAWEPGSRMALPRQSRTGMTSGFRAWDCRVQP